MIKPRQGFGGWPVEPAALDPNHIALIGDKYYLGGVEIKAEQGAALLEKAMKEGRSHTIFQPIRRN